MEFVLLSTNFSNLFKCNIFVLGQAVGPVTFCKPVNSHTKDVWSCSDMSEVETFSTGMVL